MGSMKRTDLDNPDFVENLPDYDDILIHAANQNSRVHKGLKRSKEAIAKQKISSADYIYIHKEFENKKVHPSLAEYYYTLGWETGRLRDLKATEIMAQKVRETSRRNAEMYDRKADQERIDRILATKAKWTDEQRKELSEKLSAVHKGKPKTKESIEKRSAKRLGRIWINNGSKNKLIYPEEFDTYVELGFSEGMITRKNS